MKIFGALAVALALLTPAPVEAGCYGSNCGGVVSVGIEAPRTSPVGTSVRIVVRVDGRPEGSHGRVRIVLSHVRTDAHRSLAADLGADPAVVHTAALRRPGKWIIKANYDPSPGSPPEDQAADHRTTLQVIRSSGQNAARISPTG